PVKELQIAVWVEDPLGNYVATLYVTRLTGTFGLANRPGNHFLRTDVRAPYGRRDMVLPVWAHKRNKTYGYVTMGGLYGNSPSTCPNTIPDGNLTVCNDDTIAYHAGVSSPEPFYCSPSGAMVTTNPQGVDVVSCASAFNGSKGAYASGGLVSYYPPRSDLTSFGTYDGPDAMAFSSVNDLGAVSGATPQLEQLIDPPIRWRPFADGNYVVKVELSQESDTNQFHSYSYAVDVNTSFNTWRNLHDFIGQPSVIYSVPITVGPDADEEISSAYEGYSEYVMSSGSTGKELPPDMTITDMPGTGAGRLLDVTDSGKTFRLRARSSPVCDPGGNPGDGGGSTGCTAPAPPQNLTLTPGATSIDVSFASASTGVPTNRFDVRYRNIAIDDSTFTLASPPDLTPPPPGAQGSTVTTTISGLKPQQSYYVAVRAFSTCDAPSPIAVAPTATTMQKFVVLHGCFIATAAYGSPMAKELDALRAVRDRALLTNPLGRLAVAGYYALSPPVARAIAADERLRAGARALLRPIVDVAEAGLRAAALQRQTRARAR
ncbi:MAG TPA: CFI-box-CTERM domain-containing protein, partial [Polyangia bacterium]|nr:CFI-box-CTERM domain-containing protein [Polyangia bacterium]